MLASGRFIDDSSIGLVYHDMDGQIADANRAVARLFGVASEDLIGSAVSLPARNVAVADVVVAMMNQRPDRAALGLGAALEEIQSGRGFRYDADVVTACSAEFAAGFSFY